MRMEGIALSMPWRPLAEWSRGLTRHSQASLATTGRVISENDANAPTMIATPNKTKITLTQRGND
jgi:hypothetical protein